MSALNTRLPAKALLAVPLLIAAGYLPRRHFGPFGPPEERMQ